MFYFIIDRGSINSTSIRISVTRIAITIRNGYKFEQQYIILSFRDIADVGSRRNTDFPREGSLKRFPGFPDKSSPRSKRRQDV